MGNIKGKKLTFEASCVAQYLGKTWARVERSSHKPRDEYVLTDRTAKD